MQRDKNHILLKYGILAIDILCIMFSYILAAKIRYEFNIPTYYQNNVRLFTTILTVAGLVFNFVYTENRRMFSRGHFEELKVVLLFNLYLLTVVIMVAYLMHRSPMLSRLITGYFFIIDVIAMYVTRIIVKVVLRKMYSSAVSSKLVVMVIEKGLEKKTLKKFNSGLTYEIDGVLSVEGDVVSGKVHGHQIDCSLSEIAEKLVTYQVDDVFFNIPASDVDEVKNLIGDFEDMGATCHYVLNIPSEFKSDAKLDEFGDIPVATYTTRQQAGWQLLIKRIFDLIGAIVGLIFCFIIGIFLVPAIKLDSPGPAIYTSTRIGKNGRRFKFYKFRSMYIDADERKKELQDQNQMNGLMFKMDDDPRITKVGKFIRKTSLDEFPQFWNVLIGDMSLVGTRPPTEDEFKMYNGHYKRRLSMTPGITGLWQVSGRSEITDFDEIVKLDLEYIDSWTLTSDIKILFKTIAVVLKRKGAE